MFKRLSLSAKLAILLAIAPLVATQSLAVDDSPRTLPGAYIIEYEDGHANEPALFQQLNDHGLPATKRMTLDYKLFKGASFQLNAVSKTVSETLSKISSLPEVKNIWPVRIVSLPERNTTLANLKPNTTRDSSEAFHRSREAIKEYTTVHKMTQVDKLHAEGLSGKGIRIAIIDTGVDYTHPALGGCFGPGCLISHGTDLVGDEYNATNIPKPDDDPYDNCYGHGTEIAGIIAAKSNPFGITGVAPEVDLGVYRVLGCLGRATSDVMIAGFNQAYEDGHDIITASLSHPVAWSEDPWAMVIAKIVKAGVPVTLSIGNQGEDGMFTSGSPATAIGATAVGSVQNEELPSFWFRGSTTTKNSTEQETFQWTTGWTDFPNVTAPMSMINENQTVSGTLDTCAGLKAGVTGLGGKILIAGYSDKCDTLSLEIPLGRAGAEYILYYPTDPNSGLPSSVAPASLKGVYFLKGSGAITNEQALKWHALMTKGEKIEVSIPGIMSLDRELVIFPNPPRAGLVSDFSSMGPSLELNLKPQIIAPGGEIPLLMAQFRGYYGVTSGTSMSAPLMAGIYALMMEALGTKDPAVLLNRITSTAARKDYHQGSSEWQGLAPVPQQGAGMVQAHNAIHATTVIDRSGFSFNDTDHFIPEVNFTITNMGTSELTYQIRYNPALTIFTYGTAGIAPAAAHSWEIAQGASATLSFTPDSVTIPAGSSATILSKCAPPIGLNATRLPVYSGFIIINSSSPSASSLSIPYLGVVGSMYTASAVLDPGKIFVRHYMLNFTSRANVNTNWVIPRPTSPEPPPGTLPDLPALSVALPLGSPLVRVDIVPVDALNVTMTEVLGVRVAGSVGGGPIPWVGRQAESRPFTGMTQEGVTLPAGKYAFLVRALRIFGDRTKASDYVSMQTWPFGISYRD